MQFSSALLSATALFTQAASAFYLSSPEHRADPAAYARVKSSTNNSVGFYDVADKPASISLDAGDIAKSGFMLQSVDEPELKMYLLVSTAATPPGPNDVTGPFAIEDRKFVYKGGADYVWRLTGDNGSWDIYLEPVFNQQDVLIPKYPYDIFNVTLLAHE